MKKIFLFLAIGFIFTQCEKKPTPEPTPVETGSAWMSNYNYDADWEECSMLASVTIYQNVDTIYTSMIPEFWSPQNFGYKVIVLDVGHYFIDSRWEKDSCIFDYTTEFDVIANDTVHIDLDAHYSPQWPCLF